MVGRFCRMLTLLCLFFTQLGFKKYILIRLTHCTCVRHIIGMLFVRKFEPQTRKYREQWSLRKAKYLAVQVIDIVVEKIQLGLQLLHLSQRPRQNDVLGCLEHFAAGLTQTNPRPVAVRAAAGRFGFYSTCSLSPALRIQFTEIQNVAVDPEVMGRALHATSCDDGITSKTVFGWRSFLLGFRIDWSDDESVSLMVIQEIVARIEFFFCRVFNFCGGRESLRVDVL